MSTKYSYIDDSKTLKGTTSIHDAGGLTLIHPFFGERKRFELLYSNWMAYSPEIKDKLNIIIADDCGTPAIHDLMTPAYVKHCDFNLDILRITKDLKYNTAGALNLGIMAAHTKFILIMDSDCTFSPEVMHSIMSLKPEPRTMYKFPRNRITKDAHWATNIRYLPCTILFEKDSFLEVNGFDEDFTGTYSGGYAYFDNHFDDKLSNLGYHNRVLLDITATEYMDDFVGERVSRTKNQETINKTLMYNKNSGSVPNSTHMLRFPWKRMFKNRRTL